MEWDEEGDREICVNVFDLPAGEG